MPAPWLEKLRKRKLVQWAVAYLGFAWVLLQVVDVLGETYDWPTGLMRSIPVLLAVGFLGALVVAWYHGERGVQRVTGVEASMLAALVGLAALGVVLVAGDSDPTRQDQAGDAGAPFPAVTSADQIAVAVLPFASIGGDGLFAAGLSDELHQTLSRVPALQVTSQTSARAVGDANVSADSIGRALGVAHLVEGTVRAMGDRARITARLVDTRSGLQTWSQSYERDLEDVFSVQDEIARSVGYELRIELGAAALKARPPADPEAFLLVVRARQLLKRGVDDWGAMLPEVKRLYEEAIRLDSTYAHAWAGLADVRRRLVVGDFVDDPRAELDQSNADADRALALDPDDWLARYMLGRRASARGDYAEARRHYEKAIAANPGEASPVSRLAIALLNLGEESAALRAAERSVELDPLNVSALYGAAYVHSATGLHERAIELGRAMTALVPDDLSAAAALANFLAAAGQAEEAIALAETVVEGSPQWQHGIHVLAFAHAQAGDRRSAERTLEKGATEVHSIRAAVEAALGDRDAAFAALERSIAEREPYSTQLHTDNWLRTLHDDPRWEPLLAGRAR